VSLTVIVRSILIRIPPALVLVLGLWVINPQLLKRIVMRWMRLLTNQT
jgi:hypothetical protein